MPDEVTLEKLFLYEKGKEVKWTEIKRPKKSGRKGNKEEMVNICDFQK